MAGADKSLTLQVVTTADQGGLTQTQASLDSIDAKAKALTATFNGLTAAAQAASAAMASSAGAAGGAVRDTGGGRSWTLPGAGGGGGGGTSPGDSSSPSYPSFGATPIPGNTSAGEAQIILDLKKQLAEANARVAKSEAEAAEAMKKGAGAATTGAGATKIVIDAKDKSAKSEEEATKATEEGTAAQEEGAGTLVDATTKIVEAHEKKKKAAKEGAEADDEAAKGSDKMGRGAISAAQFLDDLQYGIKGVVNNIPGLVESLGLGAGAAGALGILGVALNVAIEKFGLFGNAAEENAKKAGQAMKDAASEATDAWQDALDDAKEYATLAASEKARADAIEAAATAYQHLASGIDAAATARERLSRSILAETDAGSALELAQIEEKRVKGKITAVEAEIQSREVRRNADRQKFEIEQRDSVKREDDLRAKAKGMEDELATRSDQNEGLKRATQNLLTNEDRKALQEQANQAQKQVDQARNAVVATPAKISGETIYGPNGVAYTTEERVNPALAKREAELKQYIDKYNEIKTKIDADQEAQNKAGKGNTDLNAAKKTIEDNSKWEIEQRLKINQARDEADSLRSNRDLQSRAFKNTEKAGDIQSGTKVYSLQQQESEQAERKQLKELQEQRRKEDEADRDMFEKQRKSGVDVTEAQRDKARQREKTRRAEDKARADAEDKAKMLRLEPPAEQGPNLAPAYWQGATQPGRTGGPPLPPPPVGTQEERKQTMDGLGRIPGTQDAAAAAKATEAAAGAFQSYHESVMTQLRAIGSAQTRLASDLRNAEGQIKELRYGR